jgi:hypothetical protein
LDSRHNWLARQAQAIATDNSDTNSNQKMRQPQSPAGELGFVVSYATSKDNTRVFESHGFSIAQEANEIEMWEVFNLKVLIQNTFPTSSRQQILGTATGFPVRLLKLNLCISPLERGV